MGDFDRGRCKVCRSLCKKSLGLLTGFLTGLCTLKGHLQKVGAVDGAFCRLCEAEEETPRHLPINCDVITVTRARSFDRHQISLEEAPRLNPL